jgi:predicted ATPase
VTACERVPFTRSGSGRWVRPLQLRGAASLIRLLAEHGRRQEAREMLAPVYEAFTEGFERPDMQAAKATLTALD